MRGGLGLRKWRNGACGVQRNLGYEGMGEAQLLLSLGENLDKAHFPHSVNAELLSLCSTPSSVLGPDQLGLLKFL